MLNDIKNSIKAKLYDFAYTPFMSSFVISWIILNHKYLLIYFGDEKVADKIKLLDVYAFDMFSWKGYCWWGDQFWYPLGIGLLYVFVYPAFALGFYYVTLWYNKQTMRIKQRIEDETPITQEKARELKREHYKLADERDQALDKVKEKEEEYKVKLENNLLPLYNEIEAHKAALTISDQMINPLQAENESLKKSLDTLPAITAERDELKQELAKTRHFGMEPTTLSTLASKTEKEAGMVVEDDRTKILRFFYESNYKTTTESNTLDAIVAKTSLRRPKAEVILNEMVQNKLLSRSEDSNKFISITAHGNQTLLEMFDHE